MKKQQAFSFPPGFTLDFSYSPAEWGAVQASFPPGTNNVDAVLAALIDAGIAYRAMSIMPDWSSREREEVRRALVLLRKLGATAERLRPFGYTMETWIGQQIKTLDNPNNSGQPGRLQFLNGAVRLRSGRTDFAKTRLYKAILRVWTEMLGRSLTYSINGPLSRFFRAATLPILFERCPEDGTIRDIVTDEKRAGRRTRIGAVSDRCPSGLIRAKIIPIHHLDIHNKHRQFRSIGSRQNR